MAKATYYKVVSHDYRRMISAIITGECQLSYHVGEWTKRKYWGPMVFKSLRDAQVFKRGNPGNGYLEVWECEARRVRKVTSYIPYADVFSDATKAKKKRFLAEIKNPYSVGRDPSEWHCAPNGTYIAEQIKLTRFVE